MKRSGKFFSCLISVLVVVSVCGCGFSQKPNVGNERRPNIAVAWNNTRSYSYESALRAAKELDANIIELGMLRSYYLEYDDEGMLTDSKDDNGMLTSEAAKIIKTYTRKNSDVEKAMKGIDAVIFPGGSDISPTLYRNEQPWHGIPEETDYCAERDVSDYILMSYCLDNDIPLLGICRGMQMLSVVSGADMIQDIEKYYADRGIDYSDVHRDREMKDLVPHPVKIPDKNSLIYEIVGKDNLEGCPSWHHQAVWDVRGTELTVTAWTKTDGLPMIEAVEREDKTFCLGVQFHLEIAIRRALEKADSASKFMDYETAMKFFRALLDRARIQTRQDDAA